MIWKSIWRVIIPYYFGYNYTYLKWLELWKTSCTRLYFAPAARAPKNVTIVEKVYRHKMHKITVYKHVMYIEISPR